jgi:hypothetical protein
VKFPFGRLAFYIYNVALAAECLLLGGFVVVVAAKNIQNIGPAIVLPLGGAGIGLVTAVHNLFVRRPSELFATLNVVSAFVFVFFSLVLLAVPEFINR